MAKNVNRKSVTSRITENLNKHGRIKGKNKKETKILKAICEHHAYSKKGKKRAEIYNDGAGHCTCTMCDETFSTEIKSNEKIKEIIKPFKADINQAKFICASADLGQSMEEYLSRLAVDVAMYPKIKDKINRVAIKRDKVKNKGKKNRNKGTGYDSLGSWYN